MHLLFKLNKIYPNGITFPPQKNFVTSGPTTAVSFDNFLMVHRLSSRKERWVAECNF
jgi:hypothetical protein